MDQRHLTLFRWTGALNFIAVAIPGPLPGTKTDNQYDMIITDRYLMITREIPTLETSTSHVSTMLFHHWMILSGIPSFLLIDIGSRLVAK